MDMTAVRLHADATLVLRPWDTADAEELAELYQDGVLRRWTGAAIDSTADAARWIQDRHKGWEAGTHFALAVVDTATAPPGERLSGHVILKRPAPNSASAEVGYWTAAHARGRGVAPRALQALTDWAFTTFAHDGLERLDLLHQVDNAASCRVAQKCRYELTALLPAAPPAFPLEGHVHSLGMADC